MREDVKLSTGEAIRAIKDNKPTSGYAVLNKALDMAIEALQKQVPRKPEFAEPVNKRGGLDEVWDCPTCGGFLAYKCDAEDEKYRLNYCPGCGQCIDWSEQEEGK